MRLLLDTHVALWAVSDPDALAEPARRAIADADALWLSVVSPWEVVIKSALGKIVLHRPIEELVRELQVEFGAAILPVGLPHVLEVGRLEPHHGDPFDRLLIAQARVERLTVVTRDAVFAAYGVPIVEA